MRRLIPLLAALTSWQPTLLAAQEVVAVAHRFLDAMRAKDGDGLRSLLDANARVVSTATKDGTPVIRSVSSADFITAVKNAPKAWDERLWTPKVLEDDNLALVWALFDLKQDGQVAYCGVLAIQLVRSAAGWRISQVSETQRTAPCPGPPQ